ncbi:YwqI/YxiC family protein [Halobacillus hunanensis]|uniref:YwqI/YxiC family protein n=1 Tax=Halobacillus hunanensis TaxID=578214 RepID=UPI001116FE1E|nr:YwqI/YxiC family protein [Halobacillus hunanensis]
MSNEIKLRVSDVEQALSNLQTATQSLTPPSIKDVSGQNRLDVVDQLNELNSSLAQLINSYKTLLLNNESATKQSIETLLATDETVAGSMMK